MTSTEEDGTHVCDVCDEEFTPAFGVDYPTCPRCGSGLLTEVRDLEPEDDDDER